MEPKIIEAISDYATFHNLPIPLVKAMVEQESGGNQWACNPEPHYRYLVNVATGKPFRKLTADESRSEKPPADFPSHPDLRDDPDAEWWCQQVSWGLLQVMGAVAREHNFRGWLPQLCDIETGMEYGCRHLARLRDRFRAEHGWAGVVAAYNTGQPYFDAGAGQKYVLAVQAKGGLVIA